MLAGLRAVLISTAATAGAVQADDGAQALAFVPAQLANAVSVIDLATMKPLAAIEVGGKPAGVAVAQQAGRAYVTSPEGRYVSILDTAARSLVARVPVGSGPLGIAVPPSGAPVYVADWYQHCIHVLDPVRRAVVATIPVGHSPSGLAVSDDGHTLLSADRDDDQVSIIDTDRLAVRAVVKVGTRPFGVTLSADGQRAYTANVGSNDVSVIDVARAERIGRVPVGERPYAIAFAQGRGFVTNQYAGTVSVFDEASLAVLATLTVDDYPEGIEASADGRSVYVANWESNSLQRIDAVAMKLVARAVTANGPRGFGRFIWRQPQGQP